mmetsp:Transcript_1074/g.2947  ORF Transcript_1074/g.2947 Transcript_1074/m.2947 type:complete len:219 (-) Transcript_1074:634-1290(-)
MPSPECALACTTGVRPGALCHATAGGRRRLIPDAAADVLRRLGVHRQEALALVEADLGVLLLGHRRQILHLPLQVEVVPIAPAVLPVHCRVLELGIARRAPQALFLRRLLLLRRRRLRLRRWGPFYSGRLLRVRLARNNGGVGAEPSGSAASGLRIPNLPEDCGGHQVQGHILVTVRHRAEPVHVPVVARIAEEGQEAGRGARRALDLLLDRGRDLLD